MITNTLFINIKVFTILLFFIVGLFVLSPTFGLKNTFFKDELKLGFDLKGGSSLLMQIDLDYAIEEDLSTLLDDIKSSFKKKQIEISKISIENKKILFLIGDEKNDSACSIIRELFGDKVMCNFVNGYSQVAYTNFYLGHLKKKILTTSIQNLYRRIDDLGTKEASIYSQGNDGIVIQMPGLHDTQTLKSIIGKTAKLTFHAMAEKGTLDKLIVHDAKGRKFYLNKKIELTGELFKSVNVRSGKTGKISIAVQFNALGTKKFSEFTKQNVKKPLAIVLDDILLTNPVISEHISNGQAEITGSFSSQEAKELVILLRSGSLPAPLKIIEEHTVGPSLGAESVYQSIISAVCALLLVSFLMIFIYGKFGCFVVFSLIFNMILLLSLIVLFGITLTLPGIAGFILTIGMAVDTNILIYERIKDENKNKQSIHNIFEKGFKHAKSTIFDSNLTTLIATIVMFCFGSTAIKGFAITVSIGIFSSLISGIVVSHIFITAWLNGKRSDTCKIGFLGYK